MIQLNEFINLTEYNWAYWVAGLFALIELIKWLFSFNEFVFKKLGIKTKSIIEKEKYAKRLEKVEDSIEEIKNTSTKNVDTFLEYKKQIVDMVTDIKKSVSSEFSNLNVKMDEQKAEIAENQRKNEKTDRTMLRDRLNSGMRYFSQNKDENGNVHISLRDYEIMDSMFQEYFSKHGNGPVGRSYEDEFKHFIIDR